MGSGRWSPDTYTRRAQQRNASGQDAFAYNDQARRSGQLLVHQTLDPNGLGFRESRDSNEHPESNSIIVGLDVSGSMAAVVRGIHEDLPQLFQLLLEREYIPHPQIMFSAFSNGRCDKVPLQVGQFESDNRMDENLENMILGGGCDIRESAELILYIAAYHTAIDCYEKRQKRGYLFIITDEMAYESVMKDQVEKIVGQQFDADIPLEEVIAKVKEMYNLYIIIPTGASHGGDPKVYNFYEQYVGKQYVIRLDTPSDVSEVIALTIGISEGTIGLDDGIEDLREIGAKDNNIEQVAKALSSLNQ